MSHRLFEHSDYRSFLRSYAEDRRRQSKVWSYGGWARRLGLKGTASLTMVVNGQRRPGARMVDEFARYFKFSESEKRYFLDLVRLEKVQGDDRLRVLIMEELRRISPQRNFQLLDDQTFSLISGWYFYAIRQMCRMDDPILNADEFRERILFSVEGKKIRAALDTMISLKLLTIDAKSGRYHIAEKNLATASDVRSEALRRFHESVLALAAESVRKFEPSERELRASTFCFDTRRLSEVQTAIREFSDRLGDEFGIDGGDSVYQLAIQFFPLAKAKGKATP